MKKPAGITVLEFLVLIFVIAAIGVAAVGYYRNYVYQAQIAEANASLQLVNEAINKYFEKRDEYPQSLEALENTFLTQPVSYLLINPMTGRDSVEVLVADSSKTHELNIDKVPADKRIWVPYTFGGYASGKQIISVRFPPNPNS